jgi:hypothetical protein
MSMNRAQRLVVAGALGLIALFLLTFGVWQLVVNISTSYVPGGIPDLNASRQYPALSTGPSILCIVAGVGCFAAGVVVVLGQRRKNQ